MTRDELREKVAREIARATNCWHSCSIDDRFGCRCEQSADAAIAVVIEEAARVADHYSNYDGGRAASAIRALIRTAS